MKKGGRTILVCSRTMTNGQEDRFEVVVATKEWREKKAYYEASGYAVHVREGN